jgi:hypothetical protein|nr:MAG TPA: hypothetical protein [Caudoviricetes sp.]
MDFKEALNELIDAVADVEEHGDAIEVLQNYEGERSGETDSEWKDKYIKLESEYKKRFKERMKESATNADGEEKKDEKEEEITVEDLDFNGKTE